MPDIVTPGIVQQRINFFSGPELAGTRADRFERARAKLAEFVERGGAAIRV